MHILLCNNCRFTGFLTKPNTRVREALIIFSSLNYNLAMFRILPVQGTLRDPEYHWEHTGHRRAGETRSNMTLHL